MSVRPLRHGLVGAVDAVVVGAGQAGLAMSHYLAQHGVDHVVLERGEVANSWRHERWDSLRLLTPNWQTRLPGYRYSGSDPDGYMTASEVASFIADYATFCAAPVRTGTTVTSVQADGSDYRVETNRGHWLSRALVIASGACNLPSVPAVQAAIPETIVGVTPFDYRNPDSLPDGDVLVVGASATGLQLADEIRRSGRRVTLSVGEHVRLPRTYRGRDVCWWLEVSGIWNQRYDEIDDLARVRRLPSPQLVGSAARTTLDLNALTDGGVEIVGRLAQIRSGRALFSGGLRNHFALADLKMNRLLDAFDEWARTARLDADLGPPERFAATRAPATPRLALDLANGPIRSVVWATGFRPDYRWLRVPVVDGKGHLQHDGGIVAAPRVYALGLPVLRRRKSSYIHGVEDDAHELAAHLAQALRATVRPSRSGTR